MPVEVRFYDDSIGATAWLWDFGDGATSTERNPMHIYQTAGSYNVILTASSIFGNDQETISILLMQLEAAFSATPTSGNAPLEVHFTDISVGATSWSWDFGDGITSNEANPVHQYLSGGVYSVSLAIANSIGTDLEIKIGYVTVNGRPTSPINLATFDGSAQIRLAWQAPADNGGSSIVGYTIYRGVSSGGEQYLATVGNVLTYLDSGLTIGQPYYYQISAVNALGEGPRSIERTAIPYGTLGSFDYRYVLCGSEVEIKAYHGLGGLVDIPGTIAGKPVTSIGNSAFNQSASLTSVIIPSSVRSIGDRAFFACSALTSVTIPNGVITIGNWTFASCRALTSLTIPNSVTSVGKGVFYFCSALASLTLSENLTSIPDYMLQQCDALISLTIPHNITSIGDYAFCYVTCLNTCSLTIPGKVASIGKGVFYGSHFSQVYFEGLQWDDLFQERLLRIHHTHMVRRSMRGGNRPIGPTGHPGYRLQFQSTSNLACPLLQWRSLSLSILQSLFRDKLDPRHTLSNARIFGNRSHWTNSRCYVFLRCGCG
jgi:PKD repeat protein